MRLVATEYLSLDGVFEEPGQWSMPYFGEEAQRFKWDELMASDAQLLGRRTYEGFAAAWPHMEETGGFGEKMNSMPKYVVTSTLSSLEWTGSQRLGDNFIEEIRQLKERPGGDLLLAGSGQLFNSLLDQGLIDVCRFMVHPVLLGNGRRLFAEDGARRELKLVSVKPFATGIVVLEYEPRHDETASEGQ